MATIQLPPDFEEFLSLLNSERVEYLLVGGYAVVYHGYPRTTGDMDVWVAFHEENAIRLARALERFGFSASSVAPGFLLKEGRILRMGIPPMRIEVINRASGVEFHACYEARVVDTLGAVQVNLIDLEHLKKNKLAAGRPKDLVDLDNLP